MLIIEFFKSDKQKVARPVLCLANKCSRQRILGLALSCDHRLKAWIETKFKIIDRLHFLIEIQYLNKLLNLLLLLIQTITMLISVLP